MSEDTAGSDTEAELTGPSPAEVVDELLEVLAVAGHEPAMLSASPTVFDAIKVVSTSPSKPTRAKPGAVAKRSGIKITKSVSMAEPSLLLMTVHESKRYVFTLTHADGLAAASALMPGALAAIADDPSLTGPQALESSRSTAAV